MKAMYNIKTLSVIATLALTAAMPLTSHAGGIVNDLSNTNNVAYDEVGNPYPVIQNGSEQASGSHSAQAQTSEPIRLAGPTSAAAHSVDAQKTQDNSGANLFPLDAQSMQSQNWSD